MDNFHFKVLTGTDRVYWEAIQKVVADIAEEPRTIEFAFVFGGDELHLGTMKAVTDNEELRAVFDSNGYAIRKVTVKFPSGREMIVERSSNNTAFDDVHCRPRNQQDNDRAGLTRLLIAAQRTFGKIPTSGAPFLPPDQEKFFQAQQAAIQQLTTAMAHAGLHVEEARNKCDEHYREREAVLEQETKNKKEELERDFNAKAKQVEDKRTESLNEIAKQREALEAERKAIDDRNATHARRSQQEDIDKVLKDFQAKFGVTTGTVWKGVLVFAFTLSAVVVTGWIAYVFLSATLDLPPDNSAAGWFRIGSNIVKAVVFTAISVSLGIFLVNFLNKWFERHADEEFRIKRFHLDIKRAIWFVETAREWTEKKEAEMPKEIVDRLTTGLFATEEKGKSDEPRDALANILLGASKAHVNLAGGNTVDFDRSGMKQVEKASK